MKIVISLIVLVSGLGSAWFWYRSSQVSFSVGKGRSVFVQGEPAVTAGDIQKYLTDVANLNSIAAGLGAISVVTAMIGSFIK
ncbi:MAG TPA: hypothetical protein VHC71_14050 [Hyphomicrobium sp.]|jgi:hypothetical protein|nr:hypothetical protein [Hyphomicrobium sp.]